ncbi:hypothetical protein HNP46_006741 [Pseudomonas nitritireducens]|uniref:WH2 domain-containing protein n=1 Tax=Pseudomonas nitroreducens TaxID=46680 RepID=A0A7W7KRX4_PSENT|nr:hypothetical protein [Pseudomonas nitritireducens]MBB4867822.1 hypothetical protein [Pseudomonas nitritireducens]
MSQFDFSRYTKSLAAQPSDALLEQIKRDAKRLKKAAGCTHVEALAELAQRAGFANFTDAQRKCAAAPGGPDIRASLPKLPAGVTDMRHISIHEVMATRKKTYIALDARYAAAKQALGSGAAPNAIVDLEVSKTELLNVMALVSDRELDQRTVSTLILHGMRDIAEHFQVPVAQIRFNIRDLGRPLNYEAAAALNAPREEKGIISFENSGDLFDKLGL